MRDRRCAYCDKRLGQALYCDECGSEPLTEVKLNSLIAVLREGLTPSIEQARYLAYHLWQLYRAAVTVADDATTWKAKYKAEESCRIVAETKLEDLGEAVNLALCEAFGHQEPEMPYSMGSFHCTRCGVSI